MPGLWTSAKGSSVEPCQVCLDKNFPPAHAINWEVGLWALPIPGGKENSVRNMKDDVKERIIRESLKLFLAKGYSGSTTNELVRLAGVSKGALYWHFESKEDILSTILDRYSDGFIEETVRRMDSSSGPFPCKFKDFYKFTTEFSRDNHELLLVFITLLLEFSGSGSEIEKRMKELYNRYTQVIQKMIEEGIRDGSVRRGIDPILFSRFISNAFTGSLVQWFLSLSSSGYDPSSTVQYAIMQRDEILRMVSSRESQMAEDA